MRGETGFCVSKFLQFPSILSVVRNQHQGASRTMPHNFQVEEGAMLYSKSSAYQVQYLLGRGSFGEVAQCRKFATNENVALKVMRSWQCIEDAKSEVGHRLCFYRIPYKTIQNTMLLHQIFLWHLIQQEDILKQMKLGNCHLFNIVLWNDSFQYKKRYCLEFEKLDISLYEFLWKRRSMSLKLKEIRPIVQQVCFVQCLKQWLNGQIFAYMHIIPYATTVTFT